MEKLFYLFGPLRAVVLVIENVLRQEGNVVVKQAGMWRWMIFLFSLSSNS